jgi:endonuclease/exonuclease/phosphatase (EEP) superfamily protein YafD
LQKAEITAPHHVKAVFSKPIDHIFYRGVTLIKAEAIDTKKVSDHNPIYATFKVTADPKVQD